MNIGFSNFYQNDNLTEYEKASILIDVSKNWELRIPGSGRSDTLKVCLVPLDKRFHHLFPGRLIPISEIDYTRACIVKRQPKEDFYIDNRAHGAPLQNNHVKVVLYSKDTLLENDGEANGQYDWEIVAINASPFPDEPMEPITMARNYLQKVGGTFAPYSAEDFAKSIYFWSQYIKIDS